jgi:hypothetical protein
MRAFHKISALAAAVLACLPLQALAAPAAMSQSNPPTEVSTTTLEDLPTMTDTINKRKCFNCYALCAMGWMECVNAGCYKYGVSFLPFPFQ